MGLDAAAAVRMLAASATKFNLFAETDAISFVPLGLADISSRHVFFNFERIQTSSSDPNMAKKSANRQLRDSLERLESRQLLAVASVVESGTVEKNFVVKTGDGNDSVTIESTGYVGGSVSARLGAGDNTLIHAGEIAGDLRVTSQTATDKVTVNTDAIVGGKTVQKLGVGSHRNHDRISAVRGRR